MGKKRIQIFYILVVLSLFVACLYFLNKKTKNMDVKRDLDMRKNMILENDEDRKKWEEKEKDKEQWKDADLMVHNDKDIRDSLSPLYNQNENKLSVGEKTPEFFSNKSAHAEQASDRMDDKRPVNSVNKGNYGNSFNDKDPKENVDTFLNSMEKMHMEDMKKYMPQGSLGQNSMPGLIGLPGRFNTGFDDSQGRKSFDDQMDNQVQQISPEALASIQKFNENGNLLLDSDLNNDLQSMSKSFEDIEKQRNKNNVGNTTQNNKTLQKQDSDNDQNSANNFMRSIQGNTIPILNELVMEKDRKDLSKASSKETRTEPETVQTVLEQLDNSDKKSSVPSNIKQTNITNEQDSDKKVLTLEEQQATSSQKGKSPEQISTKASKSTKTEDITGKTIPKTSLPFDKKETNQNKIHQVLLEDKPTDDQTKHVNVSNEKEQTNKKPDTSSGDVQIDQTKKSHISNENTQSQKEVTSAKNKNKDGNPQPNTREIDKNKQPTTSDSKKDTAIESKPKKDDKDKKELKDKKEKEETKDKKGKEDSKEKKEQRNGNSKEDRDILPLPHPFNENNETHEKSSYSKNASSRDLKQIEPKKSDGNDKMKTHATVLHQTIRVSIQSPENKSESADIHPEKKKDGTSIKITSRIKGSGKKGKKTNMKANENAFADNHHVDNHMAQTEPELLTDKGIIKPENTLAGLNSEGDPLTVRNLSNVEKISKNYTESTPIFRNLPESQESKKKSMTKNTKKTNKSDKKVQILPKKSKETRKNIVPIIKFKIEGPKAHDSLTGGQDSRESNHMGRATPNDNKRSGDEPVHSDNVSEDSRSSDEMDQVSLNKTVGKAHMGFLPPKRPVERKLSAQNTYQDDSSAVDSLETQSELTSEEQSLFDMDKMDVGLANDQFKYNL